jgi:hypothetical protein
VKTGIPTLTAIALTSAPALGQASQVGLSCLVERTKYPTSKSESPISSNETVILHLDTTKKLWHYENDDTVHRIVSIDENNVTLSKMISDTIGTEKWINRRSLQFFSISFLNGKLLEGSNGTCKMIPFRESMAKQF